MNELKTKSLLLTNRSDELNKLFPKGGIYGFNRVQEISNKVDEILTNKDYEMLVNIAHTQIMERHTMRLRAHEFIDIFKNIALKKEKFKNNFFNMTYLYDLNKRPLSYDFIFFMQYVHINSLGKEFIPRVVIIYPTDFTVDYGFKEEVFLNRFRNIIMQITNQFPHINVEVVKNINNKPINLLIKEKNNTVIDEVSLSQHHREFYKCVNNNPDKIYPIRADSTYLNKARGFLSQNKLTISFTIRNSSQYQNRNSNVTSWIKIINKLQSLNYGIVIVPDTDNQSSIENISGAKVFEWAALDFKVRLALYEVCFLNIFVNNGPCIASELDENIRSLTFKLVEKTTPHTTVEYIESQGYKFNESPQYNKNSSWIWEEDSYEVMDREIMKALNINV